MNSDVFVGFLVCAMLAAGCGGAETAPSSAGASSKDEGGVSTASTDASAGATADAASNLSGDAAADASANACVILASNYDQSCTVDTDCASVSSGNYCAQLCMCGGSAINVAAEVRFNADVAKTPVGSGAVKNIACPCVAAFGPCCRAGLCTTDCYATSDTLPACSNAGGQCAPPGAACGGTEGPKLGPANSCAYDDEVCCL